MEKKNKTYTAVDFARYYAGNMEAKEMHALEKAALEDPFLADALEGYVQTPSPTGDVQNLRAALTKRTTRKKVFSLASVSQNTGWRIAAIFILVGLAGYFIFNEGREEGRTLARQEIATLEKEVANNTSDDSMPDSKGLAMQKETKILENPKPEENQAISPNVPEAKLKPPARQKAPVAPQSVEISDMPVMAKVAPQAEEGRLQSTLPGNNDSVSTSVFARRADNSKRRLQLEKVSESEKKTLKEKPAYAYAPERKMDSPKMLFRQGKDSNNSQIITQVLPVAKGEVLVGKMTGVTFNNTNFFFEIPAESGLRPINGAEDYQDYLTKNRKPEVNQIDQPVYGKVQLQFNIDLAGKPINITVRESNCTACEKQARELLEQGPLWKGGSKEEGIIIFIF